MCCAFASIRQQLSGRSEVPSQASSRVHNAAAKWAGEGEPGLAAVAKDSTDPTLTAASGAAAAADPTPTAVTGTPQDPTLAAAAEALGGTQAVGGWQLVLVGYDSGNMEPLRADLQAAGAHVVSYVPDDTWLVAGAEAAVVAAAWKHGAPTVRGSVS